MASGCQISSVSPAALKILNLSVPAKLSTRKKAMLSLYFSSHSPLAPRYAQPGKRHNLVIRYQRYHENLGNITPYDVYTGRHLEAIQKGKEERSMALEAKKSYNRAIREQDIGISSLR